MPTADVVIVGGGVIGCSIAYFLAAGGARVTLIERSHLAAGASGVAAGMLAPQVEAPFADDFFELALLGRAPTPGQGRRLTDASVEPARERHLSTSTRIPTCSAAAY